MIAHRRAPFRLGLTGGVGSGKSTVAQMLFALGGCTLLDADQMARTATGPGGAAMAEISSVFGPEFVDASGALNRDMMRTLAFTQPASRKQLEAIIHPLILQMTEQQAAVATAAGQRMISRCWSNQGTGSANFMRLRWSTAKNRHKFPASWHATAWTPKRFKESWRRKHRAWHDGQPQMWWCITMGCR